MRCPKCGNEIADGSVACNICGNRFDNNSISFGTNNEYQNNMNQSMNNVNNNVSNASTVNNVNNNDNNLNTVNSINNNVNSANMVNSINNNGNNSNNKMLIIIIAVLCVIGLGVGIYFITRPSKGYGVTDIEKELKEQEEKEAKELENSITTQYVKLKNGDYLIIVENKSSKDIMADGVVEFYNDSEIVYTKEVYINGYVAPNGKGYAILHGNNLESITYNKIVPKMTAGYYYFNSYADKITHTEEKKDDHLLISTVNNSGVTLEEIIVTVLYYDANGNIIGYEDEMILDNLSSGSTNNVEVDFPYDENDNEIPFSRYEVKISASGKN